MQYLDNSQDVLDLRDIIARVEELESERDAFMDDQEERDTLQQAEWALVDEDAAAELALLSALLADVCGNGGDEHWRGDWYPVTLIRDSYFQDYAQELVADCGYISPDLPSWVEIDWAATARNVRTDYTPTEFDGITYWYR